jgi:hypothetical protein
MWRMTAVGGARGAWHRYRKKGEKEGEHYLLSSGRNRAADLSAVVVIDGESSGHLIEAPCLPFTSDCQSVVWSPTASESHDRLWQASRGEPPPHATATMCARAGRSLWLAFRPVLGWWCPMICM